MSACDLAFGCVALGDALCLARYTAESGAAGVSSILPAPHQDQRSLRDCLQALADVATGLPILCCIFGGPVDAVGLMQELMCIANMARTKYTGPNVHWFIRIAGLRCDVWTTYCGFDEQCVSAASPGESGAGSSRPNGVLTVHRRICQSVENGELAHCVRWRDRRMGSQVSYRLLVWPAPSRRLFGCFGLTASSYACPSIP